MEPGKLCVMRQGPDGPYYSLQCREGGKPVARYVPREEAELVASHTANYERFQTLVGQYVALSGGADAGGARGGLKKKDPAPELLLAQDQEIQQLMARFEAAEPNGVAVQQVEVLVRTAIYQAGQCPGGIPAAGSRRPH